MDVSFKQDGRMAILYTALEKDLLVLLRFSGTDLVSGLFEYSVEALSKEPNIDLSTLIGTHASVEMVTRSRGKSYFDGIVTTATWAGIGEGGHRYVLTLRPWLWVASRRRNQRIFHNKTAPEIIEEVLFSYAMLGQPHLENKLRKTYPTLEYTVQYRESDLNFVCRLMERFGIAYHFTHEMTNHTLLMTDSEEDHAEVPGGGTLDYFGVDGHHEAETEHFWEWHPEDSLTTGAIRLTDFNFKHPDAAMEVDRVGDARYANGQIESFDYPGDYLEEADGKDRVVGMRVDEERAEGPRHRALGDCMSLMSGKTFKVTGDDLPGVHGERFMCLSASHSYVSDSYMSGGASSDGYSYSGSYMMMPVDTPLTPPRLTPVPVVHGPQTAIVVGEGEIDCDEFGRILVRFHWDLDAAHSMRCRVSQNWASQGWGGMVIPRIGMEVIVDFLEGDPNKPIVTGCVYNGRNMPPYELPANKTRSTFKTDTHQGDGFNELRFEDERDREEIFVHAQKDKNTKVENNQTERVNVNKVESVGHDKSSEIDNNFKQVVGGDLEINVGAGGRGSITPSGAQDMEEGIGVVAEGMGEVGSNAGEGHMSLLVEGNKTQTLQGFHDEAVAQYKKTEADSYELIARSTVEVRAADSITLTCGATQLQMNSNGDITVNGVKIATSSSGPTSIKGSVVKIN